MLLAAAGIFIVAGVLTFMLRGEDVESRAERDAALKGQTYRVRCGACNETVEIAAVEYAKLSDQHGPKIPCPKCGKMEAIRVGNPEDPKIAEFRAMADAMATIQETEDAMHDVNREIKVLLKQLDDPQVSGDASKSGPLNAELRTLRAKLAALNDRHDKLALSGS